MGRNFTREAEDLRIELERWDQLHWIQDDKIYQKLNSFYQISKLMNSVNTLIYSQNDFSLVPKRPIRMQKTFSRKMGPTRMFYDRQFLSYLKKTAEKLIFLPVSMVFLCFKGLSIAKMTFLQFQKDLYRCRKHFRERWDQLERSTIDGSQVIAKKQKVCHFFLSPLQWLSPYFSFFSGDTSNFHQTIVIDSFFQSSICGDKKMPQDALIGAKVREKSTSSVEGHIWPIASNGPQCISQHNLCGGC